MKFSKKSKNKNLKSNKSQKKIGKIPLSFFKDKRFGMLAIAVIFTASIGTYYAGFGSAASSWRTVKKSAWSYKNLQHAGEMATGPYRKFDAGKTIRACTWVKAAQSNRPAQFKVELWYRDSTTGKLTNKVANSTRHHEVKGTSSYVRKCSRAVYIPYNQGAANIQYSAVVVNKTYNDVKVKYNLLQKRI